jgi:hypothetical protein
MSSILVVLLAHSQVPAEWLPAYQNGSLFFTANPPDWRNPEAVVRNGTAVGNGFVATLVDSDTVHIGGLYGAISSHIHGGWRANQSARAKIPATSSSIDFANASSGHSVYAMDAKQAVFLTQHRISSCLLLTRRTFAHRVHRSLLVTTFEAKNSCNTTMAIPLRTTFQNLSITKPFDDFAFEHLSVSMTNAAAFQGRLLRPEQCRLSADSVGVCGTPAHLVVLHTHVPPALNITSSIARQTFSFVSAYAVGSDLKIATAAASRDYAAAMEIGPVKLLQSHVEAWGELYGLDPLGGGGAAVGAGGLVSCEGNLELSRALWSAQYAILSSARADHVHHGLSPGGLATGGCSEAQANWTAW